MIHTETRNFLAASKIPFKYDPCDIAEFECYLLEDLNFYMIVYHPYRTLTKIMDDLALDRAHLQSAWFITNDSLRSDACLIYPPHLIAVAAVYINCVHHQTHTNKHIKTWFARLNVDMAKVLEIVQDMITMYELWNGLEEKAVLRTLDVLQAKTRGTKP
ncbi:RNA polymerase II holoenzyme cyclin-like subunit [Tieghemiomyces parasiticus]|uniref:RNA polymerase II holoenzyme cyclin-like subunit n=1 Tax=Tieghemiomyces parasiticus TaxID=78921 RepID=A0A9W8A4G7_9FUNG|nr:RNA polymerase II holoenzyme cyclin-like subunit [Tieghemiomyces parasiticus]